MGYITIRVKVTKDFICFLFLRWNKFHVFSDFKESFEYSAITEEKNCLKLNNKRLDTISIKCYKSSSC